MGHSSPWPLSTTGTCRSRIPRSPTRDELSTYASSAEARAGYSTLLCPCAVHNPNPKSGESITWSGICQNGFAHGPGTIAWFLDDKPNGRFEGALARGRIEGEGTAHYPSGNHYTGDFLHGQPNGTGTFYFADGRRFEGD